MTTTLILKSGGSVQIDNAFIAGNGIAGDIAGTSYRFADCDIEQVIEHTP
jgi:hypothetical protein